MEEQTTDQRPPTLNNMNIEKTIKKFDKEFGVYSSDGARLPIEFDPDNELKEKFIVFIIKALKTQEQEHQKKLEEIERLCVGLAITENEIIKNLNLNRNIDLIPQSEIDNMLGYNRKRQEIKEIFNKQ